MGLDVVGVKSSFLSANLSGGLPMRDQDVRELNFTGYPKVMSDGAANASSLTLAMPFLPVSWVKASVLQIGAGSIVAYQPVSQFEREEHQNRKAVFLKSYEFRSRNFFLNEKSLPKVICHAKTNKSQAVSQEFDRSHCSKLAFFEWLDVSLVPFIAPMSWSC